MENSSFEFSNTHRSSSHRAMQRTKKVNGRDETSLLTPLVEIEVIIEGGLAFFRGLYL